MKIVIPSLPPYIPQPAMQGIFHSLQIGTLSTWLSLSTFGAVGVVFHPWQAPTPAPLPAAEETAIIPNDFVLETPLGNTSENLAVTPAETVPLDPAPPDLLPAPPELAPLAELAPLPEIPDLPPPPPPVSAVREAREAPRSSLPPSSASTSTPRPTSTRPSSSNNSSSSAGNSSGGNSAASTTSRLAAGRMPAPTYPASARRNNQTGTVVVEFTIGTNGRVISAYAKSPSPHAVLNEAAVSTVCRWRFPPGGVLKTQRPIIFKLR